MFSFICSKSSCRRLWRPCTAPATYLHCPPCMTVSSQLLIPTASVRLLTSSTHLFQGLPKGLLVANWMAKLQRLTLVVNCLACLQCGEPTGVICFSDSRLYLVVSWVYISTVLWILYITSLDGTQSLFMTFLLKARMHYLSLMVRIEDSKPYSTVGWTTVV